MDRAARQHRRQAKGARRRKRLGHNHERLLRRAAKRAADDSHRSKLRVFREP